MSWDIFVQDLPKSARSLEDVPQSFEPRSLGSRSRIIEKILAVHPDADFSDPAWGTLDKESEGYSIEFNLGEDETVDGFAMHVRGGDAAVDAVSAVLTALDLRALDSASGDFFDRNEAFASLERFNAYARQISGE